MRIFKLNNLHMKIYPIIAIVVTIAIGIWAYQASKYEHGEYRILDVVKSAERDIIAQHYLEDIVLEKEYASMKDAPCSPDITKKIIDISNPYLIKLGIELISIEATITYPI